MTEEDQMLVARAALHGARFRRRDGVGGGGGKLWFAEGCEGTAKWTVGRAAEYYLWKHGMRTDAEHREYSKRTDFGAPQEVDPAFIASVLS